MDGLRECLTGWASKFERNGWVWRPLFSLRLAEHDNDSDYGDQP